MDSRWRTVGHRSHNLRPEKLLGIFLAVICFLSYHYLKISNVAKSKEEDLHLENWKILTRYQDYKYHFYAILLWCRCSLVPVLNHMRYSAANKMHVKQFSLTFWWYFDVIDWIFITIYYISRFHRSKWRFWGPKFGP